MVGRTQTWKPGVLAGTSHPWTDHVSSHPPTFWLPDGFGKRWENVSVPLAPSLPHPPRCQPPLSPEATVSAEQPSRGLQAPPFTPPGPGSPATPGSLHASHSSATAARGCLSATLCQQFPAWPTGLSEGLPPTQGDSGQEAHPRPQDAPTRPRGQPGTPQSAGTGLALLET